MKGDRCERLSSEIQKALSEIISYKIKNPLITEMVSVMKVDVSKDLSHAKVCLSVFSTDSEKKKRTFDEIVRSNKQIRFELAHSVKMRVVPELQFVLDDSMEYGDKMDKLLNKIGQSIDKDKV
ncbi:MAG: 30S ribosome-binding factor RbfA [Clostridia bacterium]|nr:30S ribosome-binding factor RbfA [Clostridia bacterium]